MSITVKVTWRDIQRANDLRRIEDIAWVCPISQAVRRTIGQDDEVQTTDDVVIAGSREYRLPDAAQQFIQRYDEYFHPGPITFVMEEA